jgi:hypothetical protein
MGIPVVDVFFIHPAGFADHLNNSTPTYHFKKYTPNSHSLAIGYPQLYKYIPKE